MIILERIITILSVLTVLLIGSAVTFFTIVPKKSGMPDEVIDSELSLNDWLEEKRNPKSNGAKRKQFAVITPAQARPKTPGSKNKPAARPKQVNLQQIAAQTKKKSYDNYIEADGKTIPQNQAVSGIPWLRYQEGVTYYKPKKIPRILHEKLQHFEDAYEAAQQGGGEFKETPFGTAYNINWVNPKSHLSKVAGLQPGDKILSINGHKIGNSFTAARGLYDELKNESRFAVKILRNNKPTVLSFSMK